MTNLSDIIGDSELEWRSRAECRSMDPDIFFPAEGDKAAVNVAKSICLVCVVRPECLLDAVITDQTEGIWGGATPRERRRIRRELNLPEHDE
ncbi:MAG TPA: WhiB family transcriptional regulator [Candidatus Saccharimonadales bacterium]